MVCKRPNHKHNWLTLIRYEGLYRPSKKNLDVVLIEILDLSLLIRIPDSKTKPGPTLHLTLPGFVSGEESHKDR